MRILHSSPLLEIRCCHPRQVEDAPSSIIYIVDLTSDYLLAIAELCRLAERVAGVQVDVLLHKSDAIPPGEREQLFRDVSGAVTIKDARFHLTSVYDHSLLYAISLAVQRLMNPQLNILLAELHDCSALLFDGRSRVCLACSSPLTVESFGMGLDGMDVVGDVAELYSAGDSMSAAEIIFEDGTVVHCHSLPSGLAVVSLGPVSSGQLARIHEISSKIVI